MVARAEKHLKDISSAVVSWFQSNFTAVFLWPFTKGAKKVLLGWTKWPPELKLEKKKKPLNISSLASGLISQKCSSYPPFAKIAKMVLLCWRKWLPELKIEEKKTHNFKGQHK